MVKEYDYSATDEEFKALLEREPIMKAVYQQGRAAGIAFEDMLVKMCVELAKDRDVYKNQLSAVALLIEDKTP